MPDARMIKHIMQGADTTDTRMAVAGDKLYFTLTTAGGPRLIEYDLTERRYMQYGGFRATDVAGRDGGLVLASSERFIEKWGDGDSFDGTPIEAYWNTPLTDLGDKSAIKTLRELYLRGEGRAAVTADIGAVSDEYSLLLPASRAEVLETPLKNEGRTLRLRFANENGSFFRLVGGAELEMGVRRRTE